MEPSVLVIIFLMLPIMALAFYMNNKRQDSIDQAWQAAAHELEGDFIPRDTSIFDSKPRSILATISGITVEIDHYARRSNDTTVYYTRLQARSPAPHHFRLKVYEASAFSGLARVVGFQDVPTGNAAFDERFVVKSSTPDMVPVWLNARVRDKLRDAPAFQYTLRSSKLEAVTQGLLSSPDRLVRAARAVAAMADGRKQLLRSWKKIAKAQGGTVRKRPEGLAEIELERDGLGVNVELTQRGDHYYTAVTTQVAGAKLRPFVLSNEPHLYASPLPQADDVFSIEGYHLWTEQPRKLSEQLAELEGLLDALGASKLRVDDRRVRILWPGIEMSGSRIRQAIDLVVHVANSGDRGPYR